MSKEIIACDVDEVLFPFLENFLGFYNREKGTTFTPKDFGEYHFHGPLGMSVKDTVDMVNFFTSQRDHSNAELLDGAEDAIERLSGKYELEVVTARHPKFEVQTWQWLQDRLPDKFRAIKAIGYVGSQGTRITKAQVCLEIGANTLIDDSADHISECVEAGVAGILFGDYPWNSNANLKEGSVRCKDWPAVAEYFGV